MELKMLIGDTEYLQTFAEILMNSSSSVFAERVESFDVLDGEGNSILLTDSIAAADYEDSDKSGRIVYLTSDKSEINTDARNGMLRIFKYDSVSNIVSQLSLIQSVTSGRNCSHSASKGEVITVLGVSDSYYGFDDISRFAAHHISYLTRKSVLVISGRHINPYRLNTCRDTFLRLIYEMKKENAITREAFFFEDEYGVSYIRTPSLLNRLTELSADDLNWFVDCMLGVFDIVIFDAGATLTEANITLADMSRLVLFSADCAEDKDALIPEISDERTIIIRQRSSREDIEIMIADELDRRFSDRTDA